jgi:hypothetical protein
MSKLPIVALVILIASSACALAQLGTGTILGTVKDATGAVLPGVSVTLRNVDTGATRTAVTSEAGAYRIPALTVGRYDITAELQGFNTSVQRGVDLEVAQEAAVNFTLAVGATAQQLEVLAEAAQVDTTTSSLGGLVSESRISELPLNGRNYIDLSLMQTGVTKQLNTAPVAGTAGTTFSSNGAPIISNMFLLDGAFIANLFGASPVSIVGTTLGVDGIKEFRIIANSLSADYGMVMGSQMVMVSKGGTNDFHGDAFEYLRNGALDARNYFDKLDTANVNGFGTNKSLAYPGKRIPPYQRNDFGGAFGGPIRKDKTFFFGVYEEVRQRLGTTNVNSGLAARCKGPLGAVITNTTCPQLGAIPSVTIGSISPSVVPLINALPSANLPNNQYTFPYISPTTEHYFQVRLDHNFSDKNTFFGRYTIDDASVTSIRAFGLYTDPWSSRVQSSTLSENHIFSPALLNTARFSATRNNLTTATVPAPNFSGPNFVFIPGQLPGAVNVAGLTSYGGEGCNPSGEPQDVFTASDDVFYSRGRNSFKFGALANFFQLHTFFSCTKAGSISFGNIGDFLQGKPTSYTGKFPTSVLDNFATYNTLGLYVHDDIRAAPRVTVNVGLRYEFRTDVNIRHHKGLALRNVKTDAALTVGGPPLQNPSLRNFSPRLGVAWDIRGNGRTAVRSGVALLYDVVGNLGSALVGSTNTQPTLTTFLVPSPGSFTVPFAIPPPAGTAPSLGLIDWNARQSKMLQYNLSLQQQLPFDSIVSLTYAGSRGYNIPTVQDQNYVPAPIHGFVKNGIGCDGNAAPGNVPDGWPCFAPQVARCGNVVPSCRVNPNWTSVTLRTNQSESWYNSLQLEVNKRLSRGLQLQSAYTFSNSLDLGQNIAANLGGGNGGGGPELTMEDPTLPFFNVKQPSAFDAKHNWRFNLLYHLPNVTAQNIAGKFLNGWWVSSIYSYQTGYPFMPSVGNNRAAYGAAGAGNGPGRADYVTTSQSAMIGAKTYNFVPYDPKKAIIGDPNQWFNPLMFMVPRMGYFGTVARGVLRGPGLKDLDFALNKDTRLKSLGEQGTLQLRVEVFNLLNHPNFNFPNVVAFAGTGPAIGGPVEAPLPTAGQITQTATTSRQIQLALKLLF